MPLINIPALHASDRSDMRTCLRFLHLIGLSCAGWSAPRFPHPGEGDGPLGAAGGVPPRSDALPSGQEPKRGRAVKPVR